MEKAFILVPMNMKKADCPIDLQATWQQMADPVLQVMKVLAHNILDQHCTLLINNSCRSQRLQKSPIHIFLLLATEQVYNAVQGKATMPSTCNSHYASYITSL